MMVRTSASVAAPRSPRPRSPRPVYQLDYSDLSPIFQPCNGEVEGLSRRRRGDFPHVFCFHEAPGSSLLSGGAPMTPERLLGLVKQEVEARGFELVDFRQAGSPGRPVLQIRADRPTSEPGAGITTDECATLSRALERRLEDAGAVGTTYVLEVSSPGIERPVRFIEHWRSLVGRRVRVRAEGSRGGRRRSLRPSRRGDG